MAELDLTGISSASIATPASGVGAVFFDTTAKILAVKDDAARFWGHSFNAALVAQSATFAADVWVTNSDLLIPSWGFQTKSVFKWAISASKSGAGVATPIYTIRTGSGRATTDTAALVLTGPAQTAIADFGTLNILVTVRSTGASGVIQGTAWWDHRGTAASSTIGVGFANDGTGHVEGTSAGFDMTALAGKYISLSINGGTSAAWTTTQCFAEANW